MLYHEQGIDPTTVNPTSYKNIDEGVTVSNKQMVKGDGSRAKLQVISTYNSLFTFVHSEEVGPSGC